MFQSMTFRRPRTLMVGAALAALVLSSCSSGSSVTAEPSEATTPLKKNAAINTDFVSGTVNWGGSLKLTAPEGKVFTSVVFAHVGINAPGYSLDATSASCHSGISYSKVAEAAIGSSMINMPVNNYIFPDPCPGKPKVLQVILSTSMEKLYGYAYEGESITLRAPRGRKMGPVEFAAYGKVTTVDGAYMESPTCNDNNAQSFGAKAFTGKTSGVVNVTDAELGGVSPCDGWTVPKGGKVVDYPDNPKTGAAFVVKLLKAPETESSTGVVNVQIPEHAEHVVFAPEGSVFTKVLFASYGTPTGNDGTYKKSGCHSSKSESVISSLALNKNRVMLTAENGIYGDPCYGTYKRIYASLQYEGASVSTTTTEAPAEVTTTTEAPAEATTTTAAENTITSSSVASGSTSTTAPAAVSVETTTAVTSPPAPNTTEAPATVPPTVAPESTEPEVPVTAAIVVPPKTKIDVGGGSVDATVEVKAADVVVSLPDGSISVGAVDAAGADVPAGTDGVISLGDSSKVRLKLTGMQPDSLVQVWFTGSKKLLGTTRVDENGAVNALFTVPGGVKSGTENMTLVATTADGKPVTTAFNAKVKGSVGSGGSSTGLYIAIAAAILLLLLLVLLASKRKKAAA